MTTPVRIGVDSLNPFNLPTNQYQLINGQWHHHGVLCKGADTASFVPCCDYWAVDNKGIFSGPLRHRVKDALTCRPLNLLFAKDNQAVYYIGGTAKKVLDVATFKVLDSGVYRAADGYDVSFGYACDSHTIYSYHSSIGSPKVVRGADVTSFTRLAYGFAKDLRSVWRDGDRIRKAEPATFEPIDDFYSRDARHVFYGATALSGAAPNVIRIFDRFYATDGRNVYFQRSQIDEADPESFHVFPNMIFMSRDKQHVYSGERRLQNANPYEFSQVGSSFYYRDARTVYFHSQVVVDADPQSFEQIGNSWDHAKDKYRSYNKGIPQ